MFDYPLLANLEFTRRLFKPIALKGYPIFSILCFISLFFILFILIPRLNHPSTVYVRNIHIVISITIIYGWLVSMHSTIMMFIPVSYFFSLFCLFGVWANVSIALNPSNIHGSVTVLSDLQYSDILTINILFLILGFRFLNDKTAYKYFLTDAHDVPETERDLFDMTKTLLLWYPQSNYQNQIVRNCNVLAYAYEKLNYKIMHQKVNKLVELQKEIDKLKSEIFSDGRIILDRYIEFKDFEYFKSYIQTVDVESRRKTTV